MNKLREWLLGQGWILTLALCTTVAYIAITISKPSTDGKVHELETKARLLENTAAMHERNAQKYSVSADAWKKEADRLRDSLRIVKSLRIKTGKIYEHTKDNPIRFVRDTQRDSILASLYPGQH